MQYIGKEKMATDSCIMKGRVEIFITLMILIADHQICTSHLHKQSEMRSLADQLLDRFDPAKRGISWGLYIDSALSYVAICGDKTSKPHWCSSYIDINRSFSSRLRNQIYSQKYTDMKCHMSRNTYLFQGSFGTIAHFGNCDVTWTLRIHSTFAFNITILDYEPYLQPSSCVTYLTWTDILYMSRIDYDEIVSQTNVRMFILTPSNRNLFTICGKYLETNLYYNGHNVRIGFDRKELGVDARVSIAYQVIAKLVQSAVTGERSKHKTPSHSSYSGLSVNNSYSSVSENVFTNVQLGREQMSYGENSMMIMSLHTYMMWRVRSHVEVDDMEIDKELTLTFIDGPSKLWDSRIPFPIQTHVLGHTGQLSSQFYSTLNEITVVLLYAELAHGRVTAYFDFVRDNCTQIHCQQSVDAMYAQNIISRTIHTSKTEIYNLTYYMPSETPERSGASLALNITVFDLHGHYTSLCEYGGVLLTYREGAQDHQPLGMYCSVAVITGLRRIAKPLYLGGGSLSIIIKNYGPVNSLRLVFTLYITLCRGIVSERLTSRDYLVSDM